MQCNIYILTSSTIGFFNAKVSFLYTDFRKHKNSGKVSIFYFGIRDRLQLVLSSCNPWFGGYSFFKPILFIKIHGYQCCIVF